VAILNDTSVSDLATLVLRDVQTMGQVLLLARDAVEAGNVRIAGLKILSADLRGRVTRPRGFGVEAMQGAFTLWNLQPDSRVAITAELLDIAAETPAKPVRGIVNFGPIDRLDVRAAITTTGAGARGFNLYDGSLRHASFDSIATTGDGAVGVQVSRPMAVLEVHHDLRTSGGEGMSLVKGVQVRLKAIGLSVKPGGSIGRVRVGGEIETLGADVVSVQIDGRVEDLQVKGGIAARGPRSDAVHVQGDVPGLAAVRITAADGKTVVKSQG